MRGRVERQPFYQRLDWIEAQKLRAMSTAMAEMVAVLEANDLPGLRIEVDWPVFVQAMKAEESVV